MLVTHLCEGRASCPRKLIACCLSAKKQVCHMYGCLFPQHALTGKTSCVLPKEKCLSSCSDAAFSGDKNCFCLLATYQFPLQRLLGLPTHDMSNGNICCCIDALLSPLARLLVSARLFDVPTPTTAIPVGCQ